MRLFSVKNMAMFGGQGPRRINTIESCALGKYLIIWTKTEKQYHFLSYKSQLRRQLVELNRLDHGPFRELDWGFAALAN